MDQIRLGYKANDPADFTALAAIMGMAKVLVEIKGVRVPSPALPDRGASFHEFAALSGLLSMHRLEKRFAVL